MVSLSVEITGGTGRPDLSQAEHVWSREQQDGILESQTQLTNMQAGNGLVDRAAFIVSRRQGAAPARGRPAKRASEAKGQTAGPARRVAASPA
jgi:hypothetical protein